MIRSLGIVALIACSSAVAEEPGYGVVGIGTESCTQYLAVAPPDHRSEKNHIVYGMMISWIQGYVSGLVAERSLDRPKEDAIALPAFEPMKAFIDKYCRDNPMDDLQTAAHIFFMDLAMKGKWGDAQPKKP